MTLTFEFSTLVPRESISLFPELESFKGRVLNVTGFIEEYKGKPQIIAFCRSQIKTGKQ